MPIGNRITRGLGLVGALKVGGALNVGGPLNYRAPVAIVTANTTLTAEDSGKVVVVNAAATRTITLPAATTAGQRYIITQQVATTSGAGHTVHPVGTDVMRGDGFTPAAAKGAVCTQATARIGDSITVVSDGVGAWYIENLSGAWAREA